MTTKPESHLHEELVSSVAAYDGRFLKIRNDTVRLPNGNTSTREYVVHPGAVVVIPLLDDGRVLLERQFRYPIGRVMTEFPAGKLDPARIRWPAASASCWRKPAIPPRNGPTPARCTWRSPIPPRSSTSSSRAACARAEAAGPGRVPGRDQRPTVGAVRGLRPGRSDGRQDPDLHAVAAERAVRRLAAGLARRRGRLSPSAFRHALASGPDPALGPAFRCRRGHAAAAGRAGRRHQAAQLLPQRHLPRLHVPHAGGRDPLPHRMAGPVARRRKRAGSCPAWRMPSRRWRSSPCRPRRWSRPRPRPSGR